MADTNSIQPGSIVCGPTLPEPIEVLATVAMGESLKVIGRGMKTGMTHDPVLTAEQLAQLTVSAEREPSAAGSGFLRSAPKGAGTSRRLWGLDQGWPQ